MALYSAKPNTELNGRSVVMLSHVTPNSVWRDHLDQIVILLSTGTVEALRIVGITIRSLQNVFYDEKLSDKLSSV